MMTQRKRSDPGIGTLSSRPAVTQTSCPFLHNSDFGILWQENSKFFFGSTQDCPTARGALAWIAKRSSGPMGECHGGTPALPEALPPALFS